MPLRLGAVGFIDALGFKGIWRNRIPEEVAETLKEGRRAALQLAKRLGVEAISPVLHRAGAHPEVSALAFSDSFLLSVVVPKAREREATLAGAAGIVARGLSHIAKKVALGRVPLVFRGTIAAGDCIIDPNEQIFLGPAVDEAAQLMDLANGAFIWLAPGTARLDYSGLRGSPWHSLLVDFRVPLKNGDSISTKVVNPFVGLSHMTDEFVRIRTNYRSAMESSSVDVEVKRQNTEALLDHLEELSRKYMEKTQRENQARRARKRGPAPCT